VKTTVWGLYNKKSINKCVIHKRGEPIQVVLTSFLIKTQLCKQTGSAVLKSLYYLPTRLFFIIHQHFIDTYTSDIYYNFLLRTVIKFVTNKHT